MSIGAVQGSFFNVLESMVAGGTVAWIGEVAELDALIQGSATAVGARVASTALKHWVVERGITDIDGEEADAIDRLARLTGNFTDIRALADLFRSKRTMLAQAAARLSEKRRALSEAEEEMHPGDLTALAPGWLDNPVILDQGLVAIKGGMIVFESDFIPDDFTPEELAGAFTSRGGCYSKWMVFLRERVFKKGERCLKEGLWRDHYKLSDSPRGLVHQFRNMLSWYTVNLYSVGKRSSGGNRIIFRMTSVLNRLKEPKVLQSLLKHVEDLVIAGLGWEDTNRGGGTLDERKYNERVADAIAAVWEGRGGWDVNAVLEKDYFPPSLGSEDAEKMEEIKETLKHWFAPDFTEEPGEDFMERLAVHIEARNNVVALAKTVTEKFDTPEKLELFLRTADQIEEFDFLFQEKKKRLLRLIIEHIDTEAVDPESEEAWGRMVKNAALLVWADFDNDRNQDIAMTIVGFSPEAASEAYALSPESRVILPPLDLWLERFARSLGAHHTDGEERRSAWESLTEREREVLRLKAGIGAVSAKTREFVAAAFQIHPTRVDQLEVLALSKLAAALRALKI